MNFEYKLFTEAVTLTGNIVEDKITFEYEEFYNL